MYITNKTQNYLKKLKKTTKPKIYYQKFSKFKSKKPTPSKNYFKTSFRNRSTNFKIPFRFGSHTTMRSTSDITPSAGEKSEKPHFPKSGQRLINPSRAQIYFARKISPRWLGTPAGQV